jgi:uncharacterized repeat protein (TIGR02543 family)
MLAVMLLFTLFGVVVADGATASATRTISPQAVNPGQEVEITVVWQNLDVAQAFALQETYPDGWTLTRGTDTASTFRDIPPLAEWAYFLVDVDSGDTVSYTLTVPGDAEAGNYTVAGVVIDAAYTENVVAGDTTITVSTEPLYDLTMAADPSAGGTATDLTGGPHEAGTAVIISAQANSGYEFVNWTAPAGTFANANAAQTTFTMPAQDVTVTANFEEEVPPVTYVLTMATDPSAGGTATDLTGGPHEAGTAVIISAQANSGYEFVNWTAPAGTFANANAAQTIFTMPAQGVTVTAHFEATGGGGTSCGMSSTIDVLPIALVSVGLVATWATKRRRKDL